ncbi:hypothetical protein C8R46DRAFT_1108501 [Mycena filopes]|nr:hypothetical protein C8R46DRAFT_1108501 [Mycena filopes]
MSFRSSGVFDYNWIVADISGTCVQAFCYGIYLNLFILALHTLHGRKKPGNNILLAWTWAMWLLGTAQIVLRLLQTAVVIRNVGAAMGMGSSPPPMLNPLGIAHGVLLLLNNMVTDTLFLYRCYVIWGSRRKVVVIPAVILIVATCVTGLANPTRGGAVKESIALGSATNLYLMILTAGRIWWIRRDAQKVVASKELINRYTTVMAMILESGALYFIPAVLVIALYPWDVPFEVMEGVGTYLINIIPTLIVVRVGLGRSIQDVIDRPIAHLTHERVHARLPVREAPSMPPILGINPQALTQGRESVV